MDACSEYSYVIAPCLRGFGYSEEIDKVTKLEDFATDIKIFMEEKLSNFEDYYVVGHGMGAMIACKLALMDPSKVRGLILINPLRPDGYKTNKTYNKLEDLKKEIIHK